jgi:predicted nucleic acid-binding protein
MAILIDSSVFIGLERRGFTLADLSRIGVTGSPTLASITAAELLSGVERTLPSPRRTRRRAFIGQIFTALEVIPFDLQAARARQLVLTI